MDEAIRKGGQDVHRIEGLTAISETAAVQQYMRTGALPFWVAGILMNQRVRQLDYETLLKDIFVSLSVTGRFAMGWLQNLDFSQLPTDLAPYYQRAGATYRSLEGAQAIWETIPASTRMSGQEALREFHASRDWSHIVPRSLGGGDGASEGIFELASLNRARGDATMTAGELDLARQALNVEALRQAVEQAARVAVISGLVAAVVEGVFAVMEEGLLFFEGKISKSTFYSRVLRRLGVSVARAVVIAGLVVGLVTLCPILVPVLEVLALPLAIVSFTLLGVKFYHLGKAWWQVASLDPSLPAELLPAWFRERAWPATRDASARAWEVAQEASAQGWDQAGNVSRLVWDASHGLRTGAACIADGISGTTRGAYQDASHWARDWFSEWLWKSRDVAT